jgi:multiple sugar transport system substrate-binding protein
MPRLPRPSPPLVRSLAAALGFAALLTGSGCRPGVRGDDPSRPVSLTITTNAIRGGKNANEADWITRYVIPGFEQQMAREGHPVTVRFDAQGVDDEGFKTRLALDLMARTGADVMGVDGIWVGEFAEAGYLKPLSEVAGAEVNTWEGWAQIAPAVQRALSYDGKRYGVPKGADGRVLFYNKALFARAGLPVPWQPRSWTELLDAARALRRLPGVTPIQLNGGTAMGEATSMQTLLPLLAATGEEVWSEGRWCGATRGLAEVLHLYRTVYVDERLGDPVLQQEAAGRDNAFRLFAQGRLAILMESDYFWRAVVHPDPKVGTAPMADRDTVVGYARIPAVEPGRGLRGQDFVSMSGGGGRVLNPHSHHPDLAWKLLTFMSSAPAYLRLAASAAFISPRNDVNTQTLARDPLLRFVSTEVLPVTAYRPGLAAYPEVSALLQQASLDVITGTPVETALARYRGHLEGVVDAQAVRN